MVKSYKECTTPCMSQESNVLCVFQYELWFNYMVEFSQLIFNYCLQREKKNLQDLNGVFVFSVAVEDGLDRPTARLIKEFDQIEGRLFKVQILRSI